MVAVERDAVVTDERLAMLAAAGDAPAFQALAERYAQAAFVYAFHYLGGYDDAHDAVQETLIQVYQVLPRSRQDLPFRPWFFRILRNKCLDALRRRKPLLRLPSWDGNAGEDETAERFPDPAPLPEELYEREDLQRVLHEVIGELLPTYREVVLLRYATDLTFEEMAVILHVPVNTVKTHFQRAKQLLRPLLVARQVGPGLPRLVSGQNGRKTSPGRKEEPYG
jgi:RNA polymerase sigma-70 factor (ECF subfamily)